MNNKTQAKERVFSVELKSKRNLKNVTLTNGSSDSVLVEGTLGELVHASFKEGIILEFVGKNGLLRVDLGEDEITKTSNKSKSRCQHMSKALIVYGTRFGAAASTSEEIAKVLRQESLEVHAANANQERIKDITEYDLVIVGSEILINKWTSGPENFLRKFQKELATKKVALFVCCGLACPAINEGKLDIVATGRRKYLDEKAAQYNLQPAALGFFGGVYNFNKWPWWAGPAKKAAKKQLDAAGFKAIDGVYDVRDWAAIRKWAKELARSLSR